MRYTTLIDISDMPSLYRNHNVRLVYMHMCLKCGYHDNDRDILDTSVRRLSADVGVSVSAVRHALHMLEASKLIQRVGTTWAVKKWQPALAITPRPSAKVTQNDVERSEERRRKEQQRAQEQAAREAENAKLEAAGKTSFMVWFEALEEKARQGDIDAQQTVERNRKVYNMHKQKQNDKKGKSK